MKGVFRQFTVIIPAVKDKTNHEDSKHFMTDFFYSLLSTSNDKEQIFKRLKTIIVFLNTNDDIKDVGIDSLEDALSSLLRENNKIVTSDLDISSLNMDDIMGYDSPSSLTYLYENCSNKIIDETIILEFFSKLNEVCALTDFLEKIIVILPYQHQLKSKVKSLVKRNPALGSTVFVDLVSDCSNAFKFASESTDMIFIKAKVQSSRGCYSSILKDELCKRNKEKGYNPVLYISNSLPSRTEDAFQASRILEYYSTPQKIIHLEKTEGVSILYKKIIREAFFRRRIYISYGSDVDTDSFCDDIDKGITQHLPFVDVEIDKRIKRDGADLNKYMALLESGEIVIFLVNKEFLYSRWAMKEMLGVMSECNTLPERAIVIIMPSAKPFFDGDLKSIQECTTYWSKKSEYEIHDNSILEISEKIRAVIDILRNRYSFPNDYYKNNNFISLAFLVYRQLIHNEFPDIYGCEDLLSNDNCFIKAVSGYKKMHS